MTNELKKRIIALQKQLKLARETLLRIANNDTKGAFIVAQETLDEMDKIQWASKPNLIQDKHIKRELNR